MLPSRLEYFSVAPPLLVPHETAANDTPLDSLSKPSPIAPRLVIFGTALSESSVWKALSR